MSSKAKEAIMNKVAIMTDSVASVPHEIAKKYSIKIIPFHVIIDGKSYIETEIDKDQFYARLRQKENLPTTSAPSVGEFLEAYQGLNGEGLYEFGFYAD